MWRWFSINIGDDTHFGGIRIGTDAGDLHRGWVWTEGEHSSIREWKVTSELAPDGVTHTATHVHATDKRGRVHELDAEVLRVSPGPAGVKPEHDDRERGSRPLALQRSRPVTASANTCTSSTPTRARRPDRVAVPERLAHSGTAIECRYVMVRRLAVATPEPAAALFLTVTGSPVPVVAVAETFILAVILVELTTTTVVNVTPVGPVTFAPVTKPVPVRVTLGDVPRAAVDGLMDVKVGAAMIVTQPVQVPFPPVVVTVTVRVPSAAVPVIVALAVMVVAFTTTTFDMVAPVPVTLTFAPVTNPVPVTVTGTLVAPAASMFGLRLDTVGAGGNVVVVVGGTVVVVEAQTSGGRHVGIRRGGRAPGADERGGDPVGLRHGVRKGARRGGVTEDRKRGGGQYDRAVGGDRRVRVGCGHSDVDVGSRQGAR